MTTTPLAIAERVARTYGDGPTSVVAVHGISCSIEAGARIAVMGPSGSGKSTLLLLLAGLDQPTVGSLHWPGLGGPPRTLRPGTVGVVFQRPSLLPELDATENVALPLLLAGIGDAEATVSAWAALERLGLADLARLLPEELSGGQAQRVGIARALAGRPSLVVADEPTGQLDHATAAAVLDALDDAAAETGAAVLVSTHDPLVAERFDERWTIADGTIVDRSRS
ncbi:MAG: transporter ATP-binding protein [Actinomycetia bacterium]|nr:transporter ATP-binding protein [Actinomycetes bacterium]